MRLEFLLHKILCSYEKIRKTKKKKSSTQNVTDPEGIYNVLGLERKYLRWLLRIKEDSLEEAAFS